MHVCVQDVDMRYLLSLRTDSVLEMERHSELFVKALSVCELMAQQPALRVLLLLPTRHTKLSLLADQKCDDDHKVCTRL